jgi:hypothetical protein
MQATLPAVDRRVKLEAMALKRQHDLERLKLSLEDAGLADLFDVLNRELGVESLHDVRLLEGEDLDTLAKLPIVKRKRLKVWVRNQHPLHQARRAVEVLWNSLLGILNVIDVYRHAIIVLLRTVFCDMLPLA